MRIDPIGRLTPTIEDTLHLFFCRSVREDARRKGQMNPSYRPSCRTQVTIWQECGHWQVELTDAGGRKEQGDGLTLQRAIEIAKTRLYGW